jgi:hypothetical protein
MKISLKNYFKKLYRITFKSNKKEEVCWSDLKKLCNESNWQSKTLEKEMVMECLFDLSENYRALFLYYMQDGCFICDVRIINQNTHEISQDFFHLVAHFNALLTHGHLNINISDQSIDYKVKKELSLHFLNPNEIHYQLLGHFNAAKDIYESFQRLIYENEEPVVIIGDLLRKSSN